ncbi:hypothetical protein B0H21DRAFT_731559 [Amylocystis lapponica]|nr:hypothetical protein B0H21DRAFT_731559 [Amylocystis lapponica]
MSMSTPGPAPRPIIRGTSVQGATKAQWEMAQWVNDDVYTQQLVAEVLALRAHVDEVAETIETGVEGLMRRQRVLERYLLPQVRRNGEHERGRWAPGPDFLAWQEREECGGRAEEPAVAEPQAEAHAQQDEMEASGSEKDGAEERAVSERQTEEVRAQVVDQDEMEASSGEKDDVDDWDLIPFPPSRSPYRPNKRLPDDYDYDRAMVERALKRQRS